jgi:glycopeptide antibiotics resistance protein
LNSDFSRRLFFVWLACAATATLAPFDFAVPPPGEGWGFTGFSEGSGQQEPIHFVLNMLLFVPLGILVHRGRWRAPALLPTFILVGSIGFLISFIVECLQGLLPGRESSLVDVAANTAGALIGVFISRALGGDIERCVKRWRASTPWIFLIAGSVGFMAVSLSALTSAAVPMTRFASV